MKDTSEIAGFKKKEVDGFVLWHYFPWTASGIVHGFTSGGFNFKAEKRELSLLALKRILSLDEVYLLNQVHGNEVSEFSKQNSSLNVEADAIVVARCRDGVGQFSAFGVQTADCIPVLVASDKFFAAIHAGWRGLANGIITKVLSGYFHNSGKVEAIIGPCAGYENYEVGAEVIDSIQEPIYKRVGSRFLLDLQETALNQIKRISTDIEVIRFPICTISDLSFHSFRRDTEKAGRNLGFIATRQSISAQLR